MSATRLAGPGRPGRGALLAQLDLGMVVLLGLAALLVTLTDMPLAVRLVFDSALVLVMPGYALLSALMPSRGLSALERMLVAIAASIAATIVVGFILAALGLPLDRLNWVVALSSITIGLAIVAWVRRYLRGTLYVMPRVPGMPLRQAAVLLVAGLLFADAVLGSRLIAGSQIGAPPEQLWLLRTGPTAAQLGMRAGAGGGDYVIRVSSAGSPVRELTLPLGASETWQKTVELTPAQAQVPLVARLYRLGSDAEIRYVVLQPVAAPSTAPQPSGS